MKINSFIFSLFLTKLTAHASPVEVIIPGVNEKFEIRKINAPYFKDPVHLHTDGTLRRYDLQNNVWNVTPEKIYSSLLVCKKSTNNQTNFCFEINFASAFTKLSDSLNFQSALNHFLDSIESKQTEALPLFKLALNMDKAMLASLFNRTLLRSSFDKLAAKQFGSEALQSTQPLTIDEANVLILDLSSNASMTLSDAVLKWADNLSGLKRKFNAKKPLILIGDTNWGEISRIWGIFESVKLGGLTKNKACRDLVWRFKGSERPLLIYTEMCFTYYNFLAIKNEKLNIYRSQSLVEFLKVSQQVNVLKFADIQPLHDFEFSSYHTSDNGTKLKGLKTGVIDGELVDWLRISPDDLFFRSSYYVASSYTDVVEMADWARKHLFKDEDLMKRYMDDYRSSKSLSQKSQK